MKRYLPSIATLVICVTCAAVQLYWAGQDKQGQFHADYLWKGSNLPMSIFFLGPYVLLAVSALVAWRHRASRIALIFAVVLCAISLLAGWSDHAQYLRSPPGKEASPILSFVATILAWVGSMVGLGIVGVMSLAYDERTAADK